MLVPLFYVFYIIVLYFICEDKYRYVHKQDKNNSMISSGLSGKIIDKEKIKVDL